MLLIGGEDHKTGQRPKGTDPYCRLEAWARDHFTGLGPIAFQWSGQVLESIDGLAYIGRNPGDDPHIYIATADCGMGMTHGTIAGILLSELIQGRNHPWEDVYDPSRKRMRAAGRFASENLNVVRQYGDWLTPGQVSSPDELGPAEGAVMRKGFGKIAVYRDGQGRIHELSATCPHLGCIVAWNGAEKTWDCPCHGSRFSCLGKVLVGPANSDLEVVDAPREQEVHA